MLFFKKLLAGVGAEFRAIFGVVPLLRRPFWIAWGLCFLATLVGLLPGRWPVVAQLIVLIGLGAAGLFSSTLAKRIRKRKWVEYPDGPEVAPYLPQLITLLAGPPYFLVMLLLFLRAATAFSGILPPAGFFDALLLALDNFVRTQVFFDAAACFHLRFDGQVEGIAGKSIVFLSRFLMDLVFIKLAVQLLNAAYFRARGLGRGQDILFTVKQEIAAGDGPRVKELCQQVGDSLREAVDTLRRYHEEGGDKSAMAWRCLVTMKDYALPYLKSRHRAATGEERDRIAKLIDRLDSAPVEPEKPPTSRPSLLIVLAAALVLGLAGSFLLPVQAAFAVAVLMTLLTSGMLAGSRGWIDRLVRWRVLTPSTPDRLARRQLGWALCMLPLLIVTWSRLFQLVAGLVPEILSGAAPGELNFPSTFVFVLDNLLHLQIFADAFKIYGVRIADLRQEGFLGGLLTFLLRLVLNLGVIALLVSFGMAWFNRVFRNFPVSPNAELSLREEVAECGPQAPQLVGYHLREVCGFLLEQMKEQENNQGLLVALAASGFLANFKAEEVGNESIDEAEVKRHNALGIALAQQGRLNEATAEFRAVVDARERLVRTGRDDLRAELAAARKNLGLSLSRQDHLAEALAEYRAALDIWERLVQQGQNDYRNAVAGARQSIGDALTAQGRRQEGINEHRMALEVWERLVKEGRDDLRVKLASVGASLGCALQEQGQLDEAITQYRATLEVLDRLRREGRHDFRSSQAGVRGNLGNALSTQGRQAEAITEYRAAMQIYDRLVREGHDPYRRELATARMNLGVVLFEQSQFEDAALEYRAALEIRERLVWQGHAELRDVVARTRANLGNTLLKQGRLEEAMGQYRQALELFQRLFLEGRPELESFMAATQMNLGTALQEGGHLEDAVAEFRQVLEIRERLVRNGQPENRSDLAMTRYNLGNALAAQACLPLAVAEYQQALELFTRLVFEGKLHFASEMAKCYYALLVAQRSDSEQAATLVKTATGTLCELVPYVSELSSNSLSEIIRFLDLAKSVNLCADEVATLAMQFPASAEAKNI